MRLPCSVQARRSLLGTILLLAAGLAACTTTPPAAPPSRTVEERVAQEATGPAIVERDVDGSLRAIIAPVRVTGATPEARARDFLRRYGDALAVSEGETRTVEVVEGDPAAGDDTAVVVFEETHGGVPVYGSDVRVEVSADEAVAATTHTPDAAPPASTTPSVSESAARGVVEASLAGTVTSPGELTILNVGFLTGEDGGTSRLAWKLQGEALGTASAPLVFIDALDGTELLRLEQMCAARHRKTYDAQNSADIANLRTGGGLLVYEESGLVAGVTPVGEVTTVHDLVGGMWSYYWNTFQRDAHDGRGGTVTSFANFDTARNNAFWYRDALWIMGGLATTDIVGHELTHGLVEKTARLPYVSWSGALNEHYADVFGVMYDRDDWDVGEGSALGVIRSFSDPTAHSQPRAMSGAATWPARTLPSSANDQLGVHGNSGVFNHATYLMSEGGTHADSGVVVRGIGREKTEQIHFRALTWYMGGASRPVDARIATRLAAYRFAQKGLHGVTPEDCGSVINAYAAVGIGGVDTDNDCFADTVDNCPMDANFDQADANHNGRGNVCEPDAGPRCQRHLQTCTLDTDCCNSAPGGAWICEVGQCVDGAMCVRVGTTCAANTDCCEGVRCQNIGSASGPKQCCARSSDVCTSNEQCCGAMLCTAGECACRVAGETCVTSIDCCGSNFCQADGTCGTGP